MLKPQPNWIVPPACQGQAVTISYAACPSGDGVLKEVAAPGELPRRYRASWDDVLSDFDPWNAEPKVENWKQVSAQPQHKAPEIYKIIRAEIPDYAIRNLAPYPEDVPSLGRTFQWEATLHDFETGAVVGHVTVADHYPAPDAIWY